MYKTILISEVNEYSFRHITHGIIQDLIKQNKVIVLVPKSWNIDDLIDRYKNPKNISFIKINYNVNYLSSHRKLYRRFTEIINLVQPDIVLQNDYISAQNVYLFYAARMSEKRIKNGVFLNSMPSSENTRTLLSQMFFPKFSRYCDFSFELRKLLKIPLVYIRLFISNFIIISLVIRNVSPNRTLKLLNIDTIMKYKIFDFILCYHDTEKLYLQNLLESAKYEVDILKVKFPKTNIMQVEKDKFITVLPSLLCYRYSMRQEKENIERYIKCVKFLNKIYPEHKIRIKFHPNLSESKITSLQNIFKNALENIIIIDTTVSVAELITKESIIVSDVSSVLWHCNYERECLGISVRLDLYSTADDLRSYERIFLMKDPMREPFENYVKSKNTKSTCGNNNLQTIGSTIDKL